VSGGAASVKESWARRRCSGGDRSSAGYGRTVDRMAYTIERIRLKALEQQRDAAKADGAIGRHADLVRAVRTSQRRIQELLSAR
jgi:hypothetical protein